MTLTSALASLGLAGFWPDGDEPPAPAPPPAPSAPRPPAEPDDPLTRVAGPEQTGSLDDALNQAYDLLTRLRSERPALEGRSRELLERATEIYRRAVAAAERPDARNAQEARGLAVAAVETARAVDRLRQVQRGDRPADPELPPPPRRSQFRRDRARIESLPPIPPELPGDRPVRSVPPVPPVPPMPPVPPVLGEGRLRLDAKTIDGHPGGVIVVTPRGDMLKGVEGKALRKFEVRVDEPRVRELEARVRAEAERAANEARRQAEHARDEARRAIGEARKEFDRARDETRRAIEKSQLGSVTITRVVPGPREARAQLRKAYERIQEVREQAQGDDARFYLNAARDLYNAARRDAEAGRNERAVELARAAEALTHVPAHLGELKDPADNNDQGDRDQPDRRPRRGPRSLRDRRDRDGHRPDAPDGVAAPEEVEIHIESRPADAPPEADEPAPAEPEKVTGIGAALKVEDGKVIVLRVLPDGPAGKDGRLKPDDVLVGVLGDDGEKTEFDGEDLPEVVGALRGEAGTTVRLLVRPADSEETEVYELTREKLSVPVEVHQTITIEGSDQPEERPESDGDAAQPSSAPAEESLPPALPE